MNLTKNLKFDRVKSSVAAGMTAVESDSVDMAGFNRALFAVHLGVCDATSNGTVVIRGSDDNATWVALTGSSQAYTATDDEKIVLVEVEAPLNRYLECYVTRLTANVEIDSIEAILGGGSVRPVTHAADVVGPDIVRGV